MDLPLDFHMLKWYNMYTQSELDFVVFSQNPKNILNKKGGIGNVR